MVAPIITFWTGSATTFAGATLTSSLGQMASVFDYGTIDTGSTGSTTFFWIINNATGSIAGIADAILTSSGQTYYGTDQLGLGTHASGAADHLSDAVNAWDLQSGSGNSGSIWLSSSWYYRTACGISGSGQASGAMSNAWMNPLSGSSTSGRRLSINGLTLSGSSGGAGQSGSGWLIASYISVGNSITQGSKTGSFCLKYKYT